MGKRFLAASALWLFALPALGQDRGDVLVFGDSLSDPGNIPGLSGGVNFPTSPPYADNRFSNGPVYSEALPGLLGGSFDPSLNFAVGGALTGEDNLNSNRASLHPASDLTGVVLPGIATQVRGFIDGGGQLDDDDLVIVSGGGNDIFVAAEIAATLPAEQIPDLVQTTAATAAGNIGASVAALSAAGGSNFILPNLGNVGATPSAIVGGEDSIALGTGFTLAHNLALSQAAASLADQTGANIILFDANGIFADMQANPERYGFTNVTEACLEVAACAAGDQATQDQFLFFDSVHPTAAAHAQFAEILASTVRAPTTIAAQGDVTLDAVEDFQRGLIETLHRTTGDADGSRQARLDSADRKTAGEAIDRPTDLFLVVDHTDGDRDAREGVVGYDRDLTSLTLGLRRHLADQLGLGAALRIGSGDAELDGSGDSFEHRQVQLGLTATLGRADSYLAAFANLGYADIRDIERASGVAGLGTDGDTDGLIYGAGIATGQRFALGEHIRLGPEASFRYSAVELEGYVESGEDFLVQNVDDQDGVKSLIASIGGAVDIMLDSLGDDDSRHGTLRFTAFLDHDIEDGDRTVESAFVTSPTTLTTAIAGSDRTTGRLGADLGVSPVDGVEIGLGYETLVGDDDGTDHSIFGRAALSF